MRPRFNDIEIRGIAGLAHRSPETFARDRPGAHAGRAANLERETDWDGSMSWEQRNGHGHYYTRAHREKGRVVREYVGGGELGQLAADVDDLARQTRQVGREERAAERDRIAAIEDPIVAFDRAVDLAVSCELLVAGYHRHDRGPWRRRRGQQ
jgi:hypothetical protein